MRQIAENSGTDGSIMVGKLLDMTDPNWGYDAQKGEFTDLIKAGIIDPTKVVRIALQNATSVWLTAALGMACGAGLPVLAIATTIGHFTIMCVFPKLVATLPKDRGTMTRLRIC